MEIGDKVVWGPIGKQRTGILREVKGELSDVMCISFQGVKVIMKLTVQTKLLSLL